MDLSIGTQVHWRSLNRIESGVIESVSERGFLVRLENNKCVLLHEKSIVK